MTAPVVGSIATKAPGRPPTACRSPRPPAAALQQRPLAGLLEPDVERELELAAGARLARGDRAAALAERVDEDPVGAVAAAQVPVVARLEPVLADVRALRDALVALLAQLALADLADRADEL